MNINFCTIEEAFDNPLSRQIKDMNENNNMETYKTNLINNENKYLINNENKYFSAQGDYEQDPYNFYNFNGMTENNLNNNSREIHNQDNNHINNNDNGKYIGTLINELDKNKELKKKKINDSETKMINGKNHQFYINKVFNDIINSNDDLSIKSIETEDNEEVYEHMKRCKYCKYNVNKKMKKYYKKKMKNKDNEMILNELGSNNKILESREKLNKMSHKKTIENFETKNIFGLFDMTGYETKEIIIIIIFGLMLIFILDIFVKIGRKSRI